MLKDSTPLHISWPGPRCVFSSVEVVETDLHSVCPIVSKYVYLDYIPVLTLSALECKKHSCSPHNLCAMGLFLPEMKPVLNIAL